MSDDNLLRVNCPKCSQRFKAPYSAVGRSATCRKCSTKFTIPPFGSDDPPDFSQQSQSSFVDNNSTPPPPPIQQPPAATASPDPGTPPPNSARQDVGSVVEAAGTHPAICNLGIILAFIFVTRPTVVVLGLAASYLLPRYIWRAGGIRNAVKANPRLTWIVTPYLVVYGPIVLWAACWFVISWLAFREEGSLIKLKYPAATFGVIFSSSLIWLVIGALLVKFVLPRTLAHIPKEKESDADTPSPYLNSAIEAAGTHPAICNLVIIFTFLFVPAVAIVVFCFTFFYLLPVYIYRVGIGNAIKANPRLTRIVMPYLVVYGPIIPWASLSIFLDWMDTSYDSLGDLKLVYTILMGSFTWLIIGGLIARFVLPHTLAHLIPTIACPGCNEIHELRTVWQCGCGYHDHREQHMYAFRCPSCGKRAGHFPCARCDATILL